GVTGELRTVDWMYPSDCPLAANTCDSPPGLRGLSWFRFGAESATLTTHPTSAIVPRAIPQMTMMNVNRRTRLTGFERWRSRRRCRARRLIRWCERLVDGPHVLARGAYQDGWTAVDFSCREVSGPPFTLLLGGRNGAARPSPSARTLCARVPDTDDP